MLKWIKALIERVKRESAIPPPPFKASKRTAKIMYGLWYVRLTPDEAREKARDWDFAEEDIERIVSEATRPPSYWAGRDTEGE